MSIPLGTLWQLRDFDPADLAALDAAEVRVASLVEPGPARLDPDKAKLTLTLTPEDGGAEQVHAFGLRLSPVQGGAILPSGDPRWQVFELDAAGLAAMRRLQPGLPNLQDHYSGWSLSVSARLVDGMPKDIDALRISIRVQLADDQAPLVLFDRARVPVEQESD